MQSKDSEILADEMNEVEEISNSDSAKPKVEQKVPNEEPEVDLCLKLDYLIYKIATTTVMGPTYAFAYQKRIERQLSKNQEKKSKNKKVKSKAQANGKGAEKIKN